MNNFGQKNPPGKKKQGHSTNPFARALAETEKSSYNNTKPLERNPFSDALARTGGAGANTADANPNHFSAMQEEWQERQRAQIEKQQKKEALRKKLHDRVNPVDTKDLFDAREKEVKKEIEELKKELKLLAEDIEKFNKDVELTLMTEVADPGLQGKYYINFFQKLREFIVLIRMKVHSARTWATQVSSKKKKKRGGAMSFEGKGGHEKTKTIYDMMHHEVSNARSGG